MLNAHLVLYLIVIKMQEVGKGMPFTVTLMLNECKIMVLQMPEDPTTWVRRVQLMAVRRMQDGRKCVTLMPALCTTGELLRKPNGIRLDEVNLKNPVQYPTARTCARVDRSSVSHT